MKTTILLCAVVSAALVLGSCADQGNPAATNHASGLPAHGAIQSGGGGGGGSLPGSKVPPKNIP